jgi:hypothetical protein
MENGTIGSQQWLGRKRRVGGGKMPEIMEKKRLGDLTVEEFKILIKETISEAIDPDMGLEMRAETEKALAESLASKERIPIQQVAEKLGLNW